LTKHWQLKWSHGELLVHSRGAMLGSVALRHGHGWVRPFYEAPWLDEIAPDAGGLLAHLRGEFPCVPFGMSAAPEILETSWQASLTDSPDSLDGLDYNDPCSHGYGCVADWHPVLINDTTVSLETRYPQDSPIIRLIRTVRVLPGAPSIHFIVVIEARREARLPIGLHPILALPAAPGAFRVEPGAFRFGMTHPGGPEPGISRAMPGRLFNTLEQVPLRDGSTEAFNRYPFAHDTEEIVQLCGVDGRIKLVDEQTCATYLLTWDAALLPSVLLWISNRGRKYGPWNGRNVCLGVEPVASAFDLGSRAACVSNPINARGVATAVAFSPSRPLRLDYYFSLEHSA